MKTRNWMLAALALAVLAGILTHGETAAISNPATGEETVLWPVFVLLALSGAGLAIMLVLKKKTRK